MGLTRIEILKALWDAHPDQKIVDISKTFDEFMLNSAPIDKGIRELIKKVDKLIDEKGD